MPAHAYSFRNQPFNIGALFPSPICVSLSSSTVCPLEICWDNVTRFTARHMGIGQALELLQLPPQLQEFTLSGLRRANDGDLPSSPILHTRLETLHMYHPLKAVSYHLMKNISYQLMKNISHQLMKNIALPSLKHLDYSGRRLSTGSIIDFLDHSGCLLETFFSPWPRYQ